MDATASVAPPNGICRFPDLEPLERWGGALSDAAVAAVRAAELVLAAFSRRQLLLREAVTAGRAAPVTVDGALSPYREGLVGQLIVARFREDARRLDAICHLVRLCAPRQHLKSGNGRPSAAASIDGGGKSQQQAATPGGSQPAGESAPHEPLWPLVAKHVRHDIAVIVSHLQLDTAILHSVMLPARPGDSESPERTAAYVSRQHSGDAAAATNRIRQLVADEATLTDEEALLVEAVADAHAMHRSQYLVVCQDALEVAVWTADCRVRLDAKHTSATDLGYSPHLYDRHAAAASPASGGASPLSLPTSPSHLAVGLDTDVMDTNPEAAFSEENPLYARVLRQHHNPALLQLGAAVSRLEALSAKQVDLVNGPFADCVVGTITIYNILVATFYDYKREAGLYHRVLRAKNALAELSAGHLSGQVSQSARRLALLVGEAVAAIDASNEDLDTLRRWAPSVVDPSIAGPPRADDPTGEEGLPSNVAFGRTVRCARDVAASVHEASALLAQLQAECHAALEAHCEPMARAVNATLECHAGALLPLAQAVATVASDMRHVEACLARELGHLRKRCPADAHKDRIAASLLAKPELSVDGAEDAASLDDVANPLKNPYRVAPTECQTRCDVLTAVLNGAKNAVMQIPPALSGLLRVIAMPAPLRVATSATNAQRGGPLTSAAGVGDGGLRGSVDAEVAELEATLGEALASLHKHRAAIRANDAVNQLSSSAGDRDDDAITRLKLNQVTHVSLLRLLSALIESEITPSNAARSAAAYSAGATEASPRRQAALGGLTADQATAVAVLRHLLEYFGFVERQVLNLAADSFAEDGSEVLADTERSFTALVALVESLGEALYLDADSLRGVGHSVKSRGGTTVGRIAEHAVRAL